MTTKTLLINANSRHIPVADGTIQMIATSPPYYALRDYKTNGQIGLEQTPGEYVARLVEVFAECWRVLRHDGVMFVNLGDSYAGGNGSGGVGPKSKKQVSNVGSYLGPTVKSKSVPRGAASGRWGGGDRKFDGLRAKNLIGIPWRVAFALQDFGWYLRNDIIWSKLNPMPESVNDRFTKSHEYIFMLTKSPRYFFDQEAVKEESITGDGRAPYGSQGTIGHERQNRGGEQRSVKKGGFDGKRDGEDGTQAAFRAFTETRNPRTVWTIPTNPYAGAHFATWPPALVEPMIKAGSSPQACEHCGSPWKRVLETIREHGLSETSYPKTQELDSQNGHRRLHQRNKAARAAGEDHDNSLGGKKTIGWQPTCKCSNNTGAGRCIVLDPFSGSGTTLMVARGLGRDSIGLDLSYPYLHDCARERLSMTALENYVSGIDASESAYLDLPLFNIGD